MTGKKWLNLVRIKGGSMFIVDESIDSNLELLLSPFYRDSVGTEEICS